MVQTKVETREQRLQEKIGGIPPSWFSLVSIDHISIQPAPSQQEEERPNGINNRHDDHRGLQALGIDHATH
ncbi:MAG: hypothetical protein VW879_16230, partial [Opitutae bacterium]